MDDTIRDLAASMGRELAAYLPSLLVGLLLVVVGLVAGWTAKRVVVRLCILLRLDRLLRQVRWGADFAKADVRHTLYRFIGNLIYVVVFLFFLNAALNALKLKLLSSLIEKGVLFFPRFLVASLVFGLGWVASIWVSSAILRGLVKEDVPRASLIGRFAKANMLLFFSAAALIELDIAREIVIIGFAVAIVTLGVVTVVLVSLGGRALTSVAPEIAKEESVQANPTDRNRTNP